MSKRSHAAVTQMPGIRPGEGGLVNVLRNQVSLPDGSSTTSVGIDLATAPVPDRKYVADVAALVEDECGAKIMFAQTRVDNAKLRSLLIVKMSEIALRNFAQAVRGILVSSKPYLENRKLSSAPLIDIKEEPEQTIAFAANIAASAFAEDEATIDFFHASSFAIDGLVKKSQQIPLDAIVRVNLPTRLLVSLAEKVVSVAAKMEQAAKGE